MLKLRLIAALLVAAPALAAAPQGTGAGQTSAAGSKAAPAAAAKAAPAASAVASKATPEASGGSCGNCGAQAASGGTGETCAAPGADGTHEAMTQEEWSEFVRQQIAESEAEKPEPVDPDPFAFSVYQGMRPEFMGEQTIINGAKMKIASLIVPDPPHVVSQAYFETFERMGFTPLMGEIPNTRGVTYMSFRPTGSKNLKTVTLVPNGTGTVILASVGNPEEMLSQKPRLPEGVPVPPRAEAASVIQQAEPGANSRTAFFLVRESSPASVREYYRQEMRQRGFKPVSAPQEGEETESFEKGPLLLSVTARPHTEPGTVAVNVVWLQ